MAATPHSAGPLLAAVASSGDLDLSFDELTSPRETRGVDTLERRTSRLLLPNEILDLDKMTKEGTTAVIRVWHFSDIFQTVDDDGDLFRNLSTYKAVRAGESTTGKSCCEHLARKLLVNDSSAFKLYAVNIQNSLKRLVLENENPIKVLEMQPDPSCIRFCYLFTPTKVQQLPKKTEPIFKPHPGDLTHRSLLNDLKYCKFSDLVIQFPKEPELHSFLALVQFRTPELFSNVEVFRKKKDKKISSGGHTLTLDVVCPTITRDVMIFVLDFVYTGKLDLKSHSYEFVMQISATVSKLGCKKLDDYLLHYLKKECTTTTIFSLLKLSHEFALTTMKTYYIHFGVQHWNDIMKNRDGLNILGLDLFQELTMAQTSVIPQDALLCCEPVDTLVADLTLMAQSMTFSDAVASFADGKNVPFHRFILAASSDSMLEKLKQAKKEKSKQVPSYTFTNITSDDFSALLSQIYYGVLDTSPLSACRLMEHVAVLYQLDRLREACEHVLSCSPVSLESVLETLRLTYIEFNHDREIVTGAVRQQCLAFIADNFAKVNISGLRKIHPQVGFDLLDIMHNKARGGWKAEEQVKPDGGLNAPLVLSPRRNSNLNFSSSSLLRISADS